MSRLETESLRAQAGGGLPSDVAVTCWLARADRE